MKPVKRVSLFMDVEDPIKPLADDAALDFPRIFSEAGVPGCFCLTGEKCRTLWSRDRTDVADAYRPHSLGLHTNRHSFHPTTMELLADLSWDDGCDAAFEEERQGFEALQTLVGRPPSYWGGGGNTWSPEISDALKRLGIPAYVYALTELPDFSVHRFNGVFAMPQALSISETDWHDDSRALAAVERVLDRLDRIDQPWIGIFVGHPTKFRYQDWWDKPYYRGRTPPTPEFGDPVSIETYETGKRNLRTFLDRIQDVANIVSIEEALALPWKIRRPTNFERSYFEEHTSANLMGATGWPPHRLGLDASLIVQKTMALADSVEVAYL